MTSVDEWAVLDAIDGLVRKSMVVADEQPDGSVRYQLLETLRQYARERLEQDGRRRRWRRRHADYYVTFSEEAGAGLRSRRTSSPGESGCTWSSTTCAPRRSGRSTSKMSSC